MIDLKTSAEQKDIEMKIVKKQLEKHSKANTRTEVEHKEVAEENKEVTYTIKSRECDFSGRTEIDKHQMNYCSEASDS